MLLLTSLRNFLRNKFDSLVEQITGNVDILMISETKADSNLRTGKPFRDCNWRFLCRNIFVEKRWLVCCSYNRNKNNNQSHLALYSSNYENFIILGDFNIGIDNSYMGDIRDTYDLKSLIITKATCWKIPANTAWINFLWTNHPCSFQNSFAFETGLPDFHKMTVTITKASFQML